MKDTTAAAESILGHSQDFIEAKMEYGKLKIIGKAADISASLVLAIIVLFIGIGFLVLLSAAVAQELIHVTHSKPAGFFIVGGFYGIVLLIIYLFKSKLITMPLYNVILKKLLH